jgi:hypothetical protein
VFSTRIKAIFLLPNTVFGRAQNIASFKSKEDYFHHGGGKSKNVKTSCFINNKKYLQGVNFGF